MERRDQMFFRLVYVCGLRVSEAVNLRLEDIDFAEGTLLVIGKGDKERQVYLKPNLLWALKEYIAESKPRTYLFSGRGGDSTITRWNMEGRLKK
jgi:integrase/recombinase XerC